MRSPTEQGRTISSPFTDRAQRLWRLPHSPFYSRASGNPGCGRRQNWISDRYGSHLFYPYKKLRRHLSLVLNSPHRQDVHWKGDHFTSPLVCSLSNSTFTHSFLVLPDCPTPLLGRDIWQRYKLIFTFLRLTTRKRHFCPLRSRALQTSTFPVFNRCPLRYGTSPFQGTIYQEPQ